MGFLDSSNTIPMDSAESTLISPRKVVAAAAAKPLDCWACSTPNTICEWIGGDSAVASFSCAVVQLCLANLAKPSYNKPVENA